MNEHFDSAPPSNKTGSMQGFDEEFTDIVDYILRITYRIWEGKQVGLCRRYYSEDCPVYTLAGYSAGAESVMQNTTRTLAGFPDRTLHADNIIWGGDDQQGFHTSHLISTNMTNLGPSEFGAPSGKHAQIHVIAHCVVKNNRIVEEWLVRDNYSLCQQFGFDPLSFAKAQAQKPLDDQAVYRDWLRDEFERVQQRPTLKDWEGDFTTLGSMLASRVNAIWNERLIGDCRQLYADHARVHASARPDYDGIESIQRFYLELLGTLPDARLSIDYLCEHSMQAGDHVAVRWTLAGHHTGNALWGEASGAPVLILGESHYRVERGKVVEEWLVFDELAVLTQVERARLA
ncbi:MAG: ester cyclase [Pseudomonadota bacterium]